MIEPDIDFKEGDLNLRLEETAVEGGYDIKLSLDYSTSSIVVSLSPLSEYQNPFQGRFSFIIQNNGYKTVGCPGGIDECLEVIISVTG